MLEALDLGVVHVVTAELYGLGGANATLLGQAFADRRERDEPPWLGRRDR
ncbi:MAG: hypothetical protein ACKPBV_04075 [Sphaerospermopsis kisseleviana]